MKLAELIAQLGLLYLEVGDVAVEMNASQVAPVNRCELAYVYNGRKLPKNSQLQTHPSTTRRVRLTGSVP